MKQLGRLIYPTGSATSHNIIHYERPDGRSALCNTGIRIFTVIDGDRIRVWHPTRREVTCKGCTRRLAGLVKKSLDQLGAEQLEDIAAHVVTFVNRYIPVPPVA